MGTPNANDLVIAELAGVQHGVVSRLQLLEHGLTAKTIGARVRARRLIPRYPGVYAVGHDRLAREGRWLSAVLYLGPAAVLSHSTAAAHWNLIAPRGSRIDVTTWSPLRRTASASVRCHRFASLLPHEITVREGIPVTTPMRTLFDLAAVIRDRRMEDLIAEADRLHLFDLGELWQIVRAHPRWPGSPSLVAVLARLEGLPVVDTRSVAEVALLQLCDDYNLPLPRANVTIEGFMVAARLGRLVRRCSASGVP